MRVRALEALFNQDPVLTVDASTIAEMKAEALVAPRRRFRLCLHRDTEASTQEMLIVCPRGEFMRPHRHPVGKSESYHIVEGSMTVVIFNDDGEVLHKIDLSAPPSDHPFMFRLSAPHWHMPVPTSDWLVYHETYTGPFAPESDVEVPRWAPDEKNAQAVDGFLRRCLSGSA